MNISTIRLGWAFLTGGPTKVLDYVLDCANSLVDRLPDAKKAEVEGYLATAHKIMETLDAISWLCPKKWLMAYSLTIQAFADVVAALSDLKLTQDEATSVCNSFRVAYASWRAD